MKSGRRLSPAVVLLLLSPATAELLSGNMPPAEFFSPASLPTLIALYGGGAILIRELTFRWGRGWPTLVVLGLAYGIVEEGLAMKTFFDPDWGALGILGRYGRWLGVNWVWSLSLTIYHALISITIPVLLVGLIFPARRTEAWVTRRWLVVAAVFFVLAGVGLSVYRSEVRMTTAQGLLTMAVIVALVLLAKRLPNPMFARCPERTPARPILFGVIGFFTSLGFFWLLFECPKTGVHPLVQMLLTIAVLGAAACLMLRLSGGGAAWADRHKVALASGVLLPMILASPVLDRLGRSGMLYVGLAALVFLIWLTWRIRRAEV